MPRAGWEQQGCFVGGSGAASVEASRARMPSAAALLTAISHLELHEHEIPLVAKKQGEKPRMWLNFD